MEDIRIRPIGLILSFATNEASDRDSNLRNTKPNNLSSDDLYKIAQGTSKNIPSRAHDDHRETEPCAHARAYS